MMKILLSDEEYEIAHKAEGHSRTFINSWTVQPYLKAQALKLLDELNKPCPHETYANIKRECEECMTEIRKELQDGSQT